MAVVTTLPQAQFRRDSWDKGKRTVEGHAVKDMSSTFLYKKLSKNSRTCIFYRVRGWCAEEQHEKEACPGWWCLWRVTVSHDWPENAPETRRYRHSGTEMPRNKLCCLCQLVSC